MFQSSIRIHILFHCVAILGYYQVSSRHIPESRQCTLTFFTETNFGGAEQILSDSQGIFELDERSAKTVGRCCWRIYSITGYRGESKLLQGNSQFPTYSSWGWQPGAIQSVKKCNSCRNCTR